MAASFIFGLASIALFILIGAMKPGKSLFDK